MNSKLHQQEHILKTRFTCDLCSDIFTSEKKLCVHLDSHDLLEIGEALDFPANEVSTLIKSELAIRFHQSYGQCAQPAAKQGALPHTK